MDWALPDVEFFGPGKDLLTGVNGELEEESGNPHPLSRLIFGMHPHAVYGTTLMAAFTRGERNLNVRMAGHSFLFWLPIIREICIWGGAVEVTQQAMVQALRDGHAIAMCPGGLQEVEPTTPVYQRNGFIRIASMVEGTKIVPIWGDDEYDLHRTWLPLGNLFLDGIKIGSWGPFFKLRYPWPIVNFGGKFHPWPKRLGRPLRLFVGEPISVTPDTRDEAEAAFYEQIEQLRKLATEHREGAE